MPKTTKTAGKRSSSKQSAKAVLSPPPNRLHQPFNPEPLIFISHDSRDKELAEAFSNLLTSVSIGVLKSFRSSDTKSSHGIEYGSEWFQIVKEKLFSASDVVCLLTPRSLDRPWVLYEAGVAFGKTDTPVLGVAIGIPLSKASSGPFAQFQNCGEDVDSLIKLVMQLLKHVPNSAPTENLITPHVEAFREQARRLLKQHDAEKESGDGKEEITPAVMFEEVKVMFQDLSLRFTQESKRRRLTHSHTYFNRLRPNDQVDFVNFIWNLGPPYSLLSSLSLIREDFPWVYEAGMECYRLILTSPSIARSHLDLFSHLVERTLDMMKNRQGMFQEFMSGPGSLKSQILEGLIQVMGQTLEQMPSGYGKKRTKGPLSVT